MGVMEQDSHLKKPVEAIWQNYRSIIEKEEKRSVHFEELDRYAFYERSEKAYAIIQTG